MNFAFGACGSLWRSTADFGDARKEKVYLHFTLSMERSSLDAALRVTTAQVRQG
jgi:hypothetical protein